jgi:FMN phosphatase YigB (HAD superfamily)
MNIIFDYNRTLFDPEIQDLYPGARTLLERLASQHTLFLVSKNEPIRIKTIETLGISQFFEKITFVEKKSKKTFIDLSIDPRETIVVGDCLGNEIEAGNDFGAITIRIQQGIFQNAIPICTLQEPAHEITFLNELESIIQKYV